MLRALGEQLKLLAADPKNHYASTIRRLMGPREAVRYGQPLRRMILAMPAMIAQLRRWSDASGLPPRVLRLQRFALDYLYDPIDFLSADGSGLFRYLDDAYLIARIFHLSLADTDGAGIRNLADDKPLLESVPEWIELAKRLLPRETSKIDALLDEVARGRDGRRTRRRA
ncbi:MAG TPA: hypothetical protein DCM05_00330 [Elusimicrobia bacterium]|nr:hypothetical protein [Elusimicrobiota bacterium]